AVLHFQKRSSFPWLQDLHLFSEQQELVALIKHTYGLDLTQADSYSVTERRTIRWCIENVLPLELWKFQESESYHVVRYEALFSDVQAFLDLCARVQLQDRKSTRLNSSHVKISYAVFCLKKKK